MGRPSLSVMGSCLFVAVCLIAIAAGAAANELDDTDW